MSALDGEVQIPKIGGVKKKTLVFIAVPAVAFVGWRYWQARNAAAYEEVVVDPGYEDPGSIPSVDGAYTDNNFGFGGGLGTNPGTVDDYGFRGTTNAQWSQYATTQLVASDVWSYTDIVTALGKYLNNKPLSPTEVQIVQAAIAVAGYPPVGSFSIIPATSSSSVTLPAPSNLKASSITKSSLSLSWSSVAGASKYVVRQGSSEVSSPSGTSTPVSGLSANTSYTFSVAAVGLDGKEGAAASVSAKTLTDSTTTPTTPTDPKPSANKYPKRRLFYKAKRGDNYTVVASKHKTGLTGVELYNYQFTKDAGRTEQAKAVLRQRGPNLIYSGTTIAVPYPK